MAKLSKEAAKRKAVRDKKAAMTPARRKKKAENQRKRRAAANKHGKSWLNGKDYDHDDKRFESIKANRGNDGNGTKKESNKNTKKTKHMAFKMKGPLYNLEDKLTKTAFGSVPVASSSPSYGGYQSELKKKYMASTDSGVGTYPDPQTGQKRYYDKKHQAYSRKTGLSNLTGGFSDGKWVSNPKKETTTGKVNITKPTNKQTTTKKVGPKNVQAGLDLKNQKSGNLQVQDFGGDVKNMSIMGTAKGDKSLQKGKNELVNKTYKGDNTKTSKKKSSNMPHDKYTGGVLGNNKGKSTKSSSSSKTSPRKPIRSHDSGDLSGGYLKDTKNFSLGVDLSMPRSKMQTTVYNARSADNNLIGGRLSRRGKIAARQVAKTSRVKERVGNRIEKIKGRQERAGVRAGAKIARRDKGIDPGYFDSQKKLDAFENKTFQEKRGTIKPFGQRYAK